MIARYFKQEIADLNSTGKSQAYYRMRRQLMTQREFVSMCAREGGMPENVVYGVLALVADKLALCMAEGRSVRLDGIGTFGAKLGMRDDVAPDGFDEGEPTHNVRTISVTGVSYRTDKELVSKTDGYCNLERDEESRLRRPTTTPEQRLQKARAFIAVRGAMHVYDYAALTGLSRPTASRELRRLAASPLAGLDTVGRASHKVYVLRTIDDDDGM